MSRAFDFDSLVELCRRTHEEMQGRAARAVDTQLVARNWLFGWYIVEYEQKGADRAKYGTQHLAALAERLRRIGIRGASQTRLRLYRAFYQHHKRIHPTLSDQLALLPVSGRAIGIRPTVSVESQPVRTDAPPPAGDIAVLLAQQFGLGWSHYVTLLTVDDPDERRFYEIEAQQNTWSVRELERQIASSLFERLALSRDKEEILRLSQEGLVIEKAADLIKNPLVLEFLGLDEKPAYTEHELESAIINRLEQFLLELGKGFLFEARQKRFTFDADHFYVDLVFYNRLLRCYVLIDLKRDRLTHQDLGQMQMYVNYFDRFVKTEDELPTIGIVLCHRKNDALVELTLPTDANIFATKYLLYLPSKAELKAKLEEIEAELGNGQRDVRSGQ
jgi:predicted nuclease of restriction endonuclease-like (RecB) superfamily